MKGRKGDYMEVEEDDVKEGVEKTGRWEVGGRRDKEKEQEADKRGTREMRRKKRWCRRGRRAGEAEEEVKGNARETRSSKRRRKKERL